jgi:hypothetical protein
MVQNILLNSTKLAGCIFAFVLCLQGTTLRAQCCDYKITMQDSYGDGWNGATLEVFVNGISVGAYSAINSGNTVVISVCNDDVLSLNYTSGNYENENSYSLQNPSWSILFQDGPNPATGNVYSEVVTCFSTCCNYKLTMQDGYGDGWNGATLEVLVNDISVGTYSAIGTGNAVDIPVCNDDVLSLTYSPGNYEEENSYVLQDASLNVLFQEVSSPAVGNVYSGIVNCNAPVLPGIHPCEAIPIDSFECISADNTGYPGTIFTPNCSWFQGGDMWYVIEIPASGSLSIETLSGSINDTGIAAWTGSDCSSLSIVGCDDDGGEGYLSFLPLYDFTPGDLLYIQAWKWGGGSGSFQICLTALENVTLESSELPIVMINTLGQTIVQDDKIDCLMDIKYNGPGNLTYVSDVANVYSGHIGIEIRGATSAGYPQRPYGIETRDALGANNNVPILGMPAENDWVLISNYNDRSLVKNLLAYKIFGEMGHYSPRGQLCEVIIDGAYKGIYLIGEKIKRDQNRVNIATLNPDELTGDDVSGGYILQQNYWNESNSFQSNYSPIDHPDFDVHFVYEYPKASIIQPEQKAYIASFIDTLETALYSENFDDPELGYRKYMDVKSFIDYFLVNELSRNNDGFKKSVFFHKDKFSNGGKLNAGPVWDFDWAWKNIQSCSIFQQTDGSGWAHQINDCFTDNYSTGWYIRMLQDSTFSNELRCTYEEYRQTILDTTYIFSYIDNMGLLVQNAQQRHFQKWPLLGMSGPSPDLGPVAETYYGELDSLKSWINTRLTWLDTNIPGLCPPVVVGVDETNIAQNAKCYPNPANDNFTVEYYLSSATEVSMRLFNSLGQQVIQASKGIQSPGRYTFRFETDMLSPGVYILKIENGKEVWSEKIIISR